MQSTHCRPPPHPPHSPGPSCSYQAVSGLLATGGGKTVQYVGAKLAKALQPMTNAVSRPR